MKQNNNETNHKTFPLKKSRSIILLSAGALALSVIGIALSSYRLYQSGVHSFYDFLKYPFLIAVCLFAVAVTLGLFIHCEYRVSKTELITCYGFIKSRLPLSQITAVTSDTDTDNGGEAKEEPDAEAEAKNIAAIYKKMKGVK